MVGYGSLSPENIRAIKESANLGRRLQHEHPEIADLYRGGLSQRDIAERLELSSKYGVSKRVSISAVSNSVRGHTGELDVDSYDGMISPEERVKLASDHRRENARVSGSTYGPIYGILTRDQKIGVHARTSEKIVEDALKGVVAKGLRPWQKEEIRRAYILSKSAEYQLQNGSHRGQIDSKKVAKFLNDNLYHGEEVRTAKSVVVILSKHRKSLEGLTL